jgi:phosphatidylglycerol---prolipoprotein diacylglyceryl transferase
MRQVLFTIPFTFFGLAPDGIPIYGFGAMLFLAFLVSMWLVGRLAEREGISKEKVLDLALWVFIFGIIGARIVFIVHFERPWSDFFKIWEGGIEFYGSAVGGWIGYALGWWFSRQKYRMPTWKLADAVAPVVCVGLLLGRIGCLLNGCCYGHICTDCEMTGLQFPLMTSPARELVVDKGYQTMTGFGLDEAVLAMGLKSRPIVGVVESKSPAEQAGLERDDVILKINDQPVDTVGDLERLLQSNWPRGHTQLALAVMRKGAIVELPPFIPRTLPLIPTQLYESISMALIFFLLMAFFPYRRHYGQVFVVLMLCYAVHRFFNETLRNDTQPFPLRFIPLPVALTLSQWGSIGVLAGGIVLELFLRAFSEKVAAGAPAAPPEQTAKADAK